MGWEIFESNVRNAAPSRGSSKVPIDCVNMLQDGRSYAVYVLWCDVKSGDGCLASNEALAEFLGEVRSGAGYVLVSMSILSIAT